MQPVVNMPGMGCMEKEKWLINEGENTGKPVGGLDSFFFFFSRNKGIPN